jgi:hypothetical protein
MSSRQEQQQPERTIAILFYDELMAFYKKSIITSMTQCANYIILNSIVTVTITVCNLSSKKASEKIIFTTYILHKKCCILLPPMECVKGIVSRNWGGNRRMVRERKF